MHDNRNKEVIKRVEKGMMKANRTRNIFAIVAVALTTFMITTIFSLGINYKENMELTSVRTSGTNANVALAMPTNEQEKEIRDLDYVKTVGTQYMIGSVAGKNEADRDLAIAMQYYDNTEWEKHYKEAISNINGNYPKKENEIMLSEDALSQLGIKKPKLDMEIPLSYVSKDGEQKDTFTLSGWFRSYTGTGMAFLSESYCQEHGYTMQNSGVLSISLDNPKDNFYDIQDDITLNENQTFQGSVSMSSSSGSVYAMIILLVFFIIGSGYLLIYNVLYISISRDTRFYGLIKTLGTTEKQIKTLVKRQAVTFGCIGIPIGVILAGVLSFGIVPVILENAFDSGKSIIDAEMFFHPSIFILSIVFSALTVWISCNAPAKVAGKISPIEALRYQNFASTKTKSRNSTNGGKLHVMAYHNVFRDKKRAFLVFMSLFMGITMILGVNGMIGSMKAENYVEKYMDYNFEYRDVQFEQYEQPNKEVPQFDERFVEQIKQIDGVKNVDIQKTVWGGIAFDEEDLEDFMKIKYEDSRYKTEGQSYQEMIADLKKYANAGDYGCYITTLDDKAVEEYNTKHPDTPIDIEKFQRGETAISGMDTEYNAPNTALVGKTLSLTADSSDGKATDFLIDGSFYFEDYKNNLSYSMDQRKDISIVPDIIYVSEAGMERLTKTPIISGIGIDIKDINQLEEIDSELQTLNGTLTKTEWSYTSPVGIIEEFNQMNYSLNLLGNGAAVLLIVIGLINFINVMLTGVVARKNEFAVMESIGTSKKQIKKILTLEGGIYALVTTGLIMTLGNAFLLLVADAVPHMADYAKFEYPFALVICLIFAIFMICLSVPAIVYRAVSKETVIERLHDLGN
ncbi:TPA: ABC transporter permease [Clostridioides difficile]|uniref:ABC transporter permease n=1 Tax=Clostridioides difficile TaxID=1496 RepID=UPI001C1A396E|nr:ABC transporter permease [Clostridioides difficile]MCU6123818.1 ABC transporter permease [Clostridioides difficile]HBF6535005.1 ABC transporter permease [Clostridioides difficile]HBH1331262.1 ABC transporter permease [Clostridioides difficile]